MHQIHYLSLIFWPQIKLPATDDNSPKEESIVPDPEQQLIMMDKSWMSKSRTSEQYKNGVEQFLSSAFCNVRQGGKILCLCARCANKSTRNYDDVKTHLRCDGIL